MIGATDNFGAYSDNAKNLLFVSGGYLVLKIPLKEKKYQVKSNSSNK